MAELARAEVVIGGDDTPLVRALARSEARMKAAGQRLSSIGRRLSASVTLPLAAIGAGATKAFADFDDAMTQSQAIMGDVSETMNRRMVSAARNVARTTTTSSEQAAESFFFLASAGLDAEQSVAALPQVARFAQAGMFDMAEATDLATDAQSALGLTVDDASQNMENLTRVTDVLVKANQLANASVKQFSRSLTNRAAAALKVANKDVEEGVAVLAAFADQGIKGQRAGMSLSRMMRLLSTNAAKNTEEFRRLGLVDAEGNLASMSEIVRVLTEDMAGLSDTQQAARLEQLGFTARVQQVIKPLLGTADAIAEYERQLRKASGATREVSEKQLQSFSAQMTIAKNNIVIGAQALGEVLAPAILRVAQTVGGLAQRFANLDPGVVRMVALVGTLAAALGPVLIVLGAAVSSVGALTGAIGTAVGALTTGATAIGAFVVGLNPAVLAVAALVAAVAAVPGGFQALTNAARRAVNLTVGALRLLGSVAMIVFDEFLREPFRRAIEFIRDKGEAVFGAVATALERLGRLGSDAAESIRSAFADATDDLEEQGGDLGARISEAAREAFGTDYVGGFVDIVGDGINAAQAKVQEALDRLRRAREAGTAEGAEAEGAPGPGGVSPTGGVARRGFETLGRAAGVNLRSAFRTATRGIEGLGLKAEDVGQSIGQNFTRAFGQIIDGTKSAAEAFSALASAILSDLAKMIARALIFRAITSVIGGPFGLAGAGGGVNQIPGFQRGGMFSGRRPFIAGERGPELVVPSGAGAVVPNDRLTGGNAGAVASEILGRVGSPPGNAPPSTIETDRWWREVFSRLDRQERELRGER